MDSNLMSQLLMWLIGVMTVCGGVGALGALLALGRSSSPSKH
ncbi:hypothetical protein [Microbacterium sp.]